MSRIEQMNKKNKTSERMSDALFGELKESLGQALQHARGKRADLRVTVLPAPPSPMSRSEIVELRGELNCSQAGENAKGSNVIPEDHR
jgi:flagellar biosynthesis/type III secretory pathway ATPase